MCGLIFVFVCAVDISMCGLIFVSLWVCVLVRAGGQVP